MSFCILPSIHTNNAIYKHIKVDANVVANEVVANAVANEVVANAVVANEVANEVVANEVAVAANEVVAVANACAAAVDEIFINKTLYKYLKGVKEQIDCRLEQWDKYKKITNPYEYIHSIIPNTKQAVSTLKPISRSFFKMVEVCHTFFLLDTLPADKCKSFHLAEGPGGFIEAMAYMRKNPNDTYYGMTLIDEVNHNVPGWRKSRHFLATNPNVIIEAGVDGTGDLTKAENLRYCYDTYNGQMDIITGDGGFDFSFQYPQQEQVSTKLILCQIAFAIAMQKTGGTFILKVYDTFTRISLDLLFLLYNLYEEVILIKPNTSRFANSEKYVICKKFRNMNTLETVKLLHKLLLLKSESVMHSLFDFELPYFFINKIEEYNAILGQQQIDTIVSTIYLIDNNNKYDKVEHLKKKYVQKCIAWCQKFTVPYNNVIQTNNMFLSSTSQRCILE